MLIKNLLVITKQIKKECRISKPVERKKETSINAKEGGQEVRKHKMNDRNGHVLHNWETLNK